MTKPIQTSDDSHSKFSKWLYAPQSKGIQPFDIKRYLIPAVTAYACGIGLILSRFRAAAGELFCYLLFVAAVYLVLTLAVAVRRRIRRTAGPAVFLRFKWQALSVAMLLFFLMGMWRAHYALEWQYKTLQDAAGTTVWVRGTVESVPAVTNSGYRVGFTLLPYEMENTNREALRPLNGKIQVYLPLEYASLRRGDALEGYLELEEPNGAQFPGGFHYGSYLRQNGIPVLGFGRSVTVTEEKPDRSLLMKLQDVGFLLNQSIQSSVERHFSYDADSAALVTGILIGDKSGFTDEMYQDFSRSGFLHVAAVSGMHVSFLIAALSLLLTRIRLPKSVIHLLLIPILVLFAAAASFTPSVCRAVLMMILFLLSYTLQREPDQRTALFFAAGILLTVNPHLLFNAGFLLSFGSVLSIQLFGNMFAKRFAAPGRFLGRRFPHSAAARLTVRASDHLASGLAVSTAATLGTAYFSVCVFHTLSLAGIFANIWVIPCVTVIFLGGYAIWLLDFLSPVFGQILRCGMAPLIELIKKTAEWLSDSPLVFQTAGLPAEAFGFYLVLLFLLYFYLKHSDQIKISAKNADI